MKDFPPGCRAQGHAALESDPLERGWLSLGPRPDQVQTLLTGWSYKCNRKQEGTQRPYIYFWLHLTQECTKSLILVPGKSLCGGGRARQTDLLIYVGLPCLQGSVCTRATHTWPHSHNPSSLPYPNTHNSSGTTEARIEYLAHCWVPRASLQ